MGGSDNSRQPVDVLCVWSSIRQAATDEFHFTR